MDRNEKNVYNFSSSLVKKPFMNREKVKKYFMILQKKKKKRFISRELEFLSS